MNERIDNLIAEANRWVIDSNKYPLEEGELRPIKDHIVSMRQYESKRKLAELIIQECIVLCKTSMGNKDYNTGRLHCLENIKEHFGIGDE